MDDLADEAFVVTRPGYWQRALLDRLFAEAGQRPRGGTTVVTRPVLTS
jgi:hypothetical protein